jgi:hypothetical protein
LDPEIPCNILSKTQRGYLLKLCQQYCYDHLASGAEADEARQRPGRTIGARHQVEDSRANIDVNGTTEADGDANVNDAAGPDTNAGADTEADAAAIGDDNEGSPQPRSKARSPSPWARHS